MEKVDSMPYKDPKKDRNYKKEYQEQKARGEGKRRDERQRARRAIDKAYTGSETKEAPERKGKDVAHVKALDLGGSNKQGVFIESSSGNRSFKRDSKGNLVSEKAKGEKGGDKKLSKVFKLKK
jgi:hypothetical protein